LRESLLVVAWWRSWRWRRGSRSPTFRRVGRSPVVGFALHGPARCRGRRDDGTHRAMSHRAATPTPLRLRGPSPENPLPVLPLTNEQANGDHPGQHDGFERLVADGSIEAFTRAAPRMIAKSKGESGALREVLEIIRAKRPNVVVQVTPSGSSYTEDWFRALEATP